MSHNKTRIQDRLSNLHAKKVSDKFKDSTSPANCLDFIDSVKNSSKLATDHSNVWTIDVLPNLLPIQMYCMHLAKTVGKHADASNLAKISQGSVAAYLSGLVFAFFLISDAYARPNPSAHASFWLNDFDRNEFISFLSELCLPDELLTVLTQIAPSELDSMPSLFFIPSAAGFDIRHHYGRFLPVSFFLAIHNCCAKTPGSTNLTDILDKLLQTVLFTFKKTDTSVMTVYFSDLLGLHQDGTDLHYPATKLFQVFETIFNPVLFRDEQRRKSLASIPFFYDEYDTTFPNPYSIFFSHDKDNISELKTVFSELSEFCGSHFKCTNTLSSAIKNMSGSLITQHAYSEFAMPTWILTNTMPSLPDIDSELVPIKPSAYAKRIDFLEPPTNAKFPTTTSQLIPTLSGTVDYTYNDGKTDRTEHIDVITDQNWKISSQNYPSCLVSEVNKSKSLPSPGTDFVKFSNWSAAPNLLILDTSGTATVSGYMTGLAGMIIESYELDGTSVPIPSPVQAIGEQNMIFADSAIDADHCVQSISFTGFHPTNATAAIPPLNRARPEEQYFHPASTLLIDRTTILLPSFHRMTVDPFINTTLPGLTPSSNWIWLRKTLRFIGFKTDLRRQHPVNPSPPGCKELSLYVFSPYTYVASLTTDKFGEVIRKDKKIYFLTNLRTMFGTSTQLVECVHPYKSIPAK